jgi:ABC-type transport system involved in multi-copper enzyme maturation permease subunit
MNVLAIAAVTLRELLRRKVQVNLLVFGTLMVLASYVISLLTLGFMHRILADLGLSAMQLIGTLLAVFLGSTVIAGDVERRVLYPIIAKPVSRTQYLLGRFAGLAIALVLNLAVMAVALAAVLVFEAGSLATLDRAFFAAVAMMGVQVVVVAAVAVFFSSLTSSTLAAIFTLSLAIAGNLTNEVRNLWKGGAEWLGTVVWYAVPNLGALSLNESVVYRTPIPDGTVYAAVYAVLYAAAALAIASFLFERRDLR